MANTLGEANPYRYRGYRVDTETGLYYLQSRYYDAVVGRFVSADDSTILLKYFDELIATNQLSYCGNCPIMNIDQDGHYTTTNTSPKTYGGMIGIGIQVALNVNIPFATGFIGAELIWFFPDNNFRNGLIPWAYWFYGGSYGINLDIKKLLTAQACSNPKGVLSAMGLGFSVNFSVSFFVVKAKSFQSPFDYTGPFCIEQLTAIGVTGSHAFDPSRNVQTYGVGTTFTFGLKGMGFMVFGSFYGASVYRSIFFGPGVSSLYSLVKSKT